MDCFGLSAVAYFSQIANFDNRYYRQYCTPQLINELKRLSKQRAILPKGRFWRDLSCHGECAAKKLDQKSNYVKILKRNKVDRKYM